jgi:shikimate dehydrogenase
VDLVVSTLPNGAADPYAALIAASGAAVFDVVYAPWPTPLGAAAAAAGNVVVGGFPMLLHQAVRQVELMTGRTDVPVEAMRAAGEAALRPARR